MPEKLKGDSQIEQTSKEVEKETSIQIGQVYRVARQDILGYRYSDDYDKGHYVEVRILSGPDEYGRYKVTTRGEDGKHLGTGGGWEEGSETEQNLTFTAQELESIQ